MLKTIRNYVRRTNRGVSLTKETFYTDISDIKYGVLTIHLAIKKYEIPYSTLQKRKKGSRCKNCVSQGRSSVIPQEEE